MCVIEKYVVWRNARAAHGPLNAFLHRWRGRSASGTLMLFYNFNFACASRAYLQVAKKIQYKNMQIYQKLHINMERIFKILDSAQNFNIGQSVHSAH